MKETSIGKSANKPIKKKATKQVVKRVPRKLKPYKITSDLLKEFTERSPQCSLRFTDGKVYIENLFGLNSPVFSFDDDDSNIVDVLNAVSIRDQIDAIIHDDDKCIEFVYHYVPETDNQHLDREFTFNFCGKGFRCRFAEPTARMLKIASGYTKGSDAVDSPAQQFLVFRDSQRQEKLSDRSKEFFRTRKPRNFFIHFDAPLNEIELEPLCRHINFHAAYYDRETPFIQFRRKEEALPAKVKRLQMIEESFPTAISAREMDPLLLQLMETARNSPARFAFVYYYQVIEYAAFHYLDSKNRKALMQIVGNPSIASCREEAINELFGLLPELNKSEDDRKLAVIKEYCIPRELWKEVENDREFFETAVEFDGGVVIDPLVTSGITIEEWEKHQMLKLFNNLKDIRNLLVHAREKRQNKVILPSVSNNRKLLRYLPMIRRVAEQIAIYRD